MQKKILLASGSPRRQEMLATLGIRFRISVPEVDETFIPGTSASKSAIDLAIKKAALFRSEKDVVLAMDTIVAIGRNKLGKPSDATDAMRMLKLLNGKSHKVVTGVAVLWRSKLITAMESTQVEFRKMTVGEMEWYIKSGEPFGKAGAYAIQGLGRMFVKRINGCYYNVVGFPMGCFLDCLKRHGLDVFEFMDQSKYPL